MKFLIFIALVFSALNSHALMGGQAAAPIPMPTCDDSQLGYKECSNQMDIYTTALAQAQAQNKILVVVLGYERCPWCADLDKFLADPQYSSALSPYVFVNIAFYNMKMKKVDGAEDVDALLRKMSVDGPAVDGFPFFYVVDPQTKQSIAQESGSLEKNDEAHGIYSHDPDAVLKALEKDAGEAKVPMIKLTITIN